MNFRSSRQEVSRVSRFSQLSVEVFVQSGIYSVSRTVPVVYRKNGGNSLKKLWCCVGGEG